MPSESEMLDDLAAADAAGDIPTAQHIAGLIKASRQAPAPTVGRAEALLRGGAQGATMGWGDEAEARWKSLFPKTLGGGDYKETRDQLRKDEANARSQHPGWYTGGEVGGAVLPAIAATLATGGAAAPTGLRLALAAGQGAAQGAGYSDAGDARTLARDTLLGAGMGTAGFGAGEALGAAGRGVARFARSRSTAATAKAGEQAAQEVADKIASAKGAYGGEVQKGNRIVENLRRLRADLSPEEQAAVDDLEQKLTQSTREALPGQADAIAAKEAEFAAAKEGASDALASRKAELLSTGEAKSQTLARLLRYGPVAAGTALGTAVGGPFGSAVGALAGAGTRPMIQSLRRLAKTPAVQKAIFDQLAETAEGQGTSGGAGALLRRLLQSGAAAPTTQALEAPP